MRTESSKETGRSQGSNKSESRSEKESRGAEKASDEARKAADDARKAADDARRAAAEASRASTADARRQATRRAEEAARQATALSQKANEAAQRAEQAARSTQQNARPGTADAQAVQSANKATEAARAAAKASTQAASEATKTLQSLRTPGSGDGFTATSTATTPANSTAGATQAGPLPPAAQASVDQARQAQSAAQTAAAASMRADQRVRDAQAQVLQAQQAATLARNDLDKGYQGYDPVGTHRGELQRAANSAMADLAAARQSLAAAQAEASAASERARGAATTADQAAHRLEQVARQHPEASVALNAAATDTRRAAAAARSGATLAAEAAKPQPIATVSYDLRFDRGNNGGQHDIIFDGAVVGGNGQVYPPGTDASQVPGTRPNDGTQFTGERIYYVNGIQNTAAFQSQSIQNIANATGAEVVGIHNSTESMALDLQQCVLDKLPSFASTNAATRALAVQLVKDIEAGRPIHLMAHSQGGLVTSGALTLAKEYLETIKPGNKAQADALLKNIKVETFGSAAASWPYGPQYTHYINENDTVPMITGLGRQADPGRQQNAGGDRAQLHFIRDDPRTPNPLLWSPETNLAANIPAHDFNDGYLHHRQSWEEGHSNSADLSGPSPVASRDPKTNELQGYYYYHLDTDAPRMQDARELRNGYEQFWQSISSAGQAVTTGLNEAGQAVVTGLNQAGEAVTAGFEAAGQAVWNGASAVGRFLNPWD
jgi:hypothetical protein